MPDPTTAANAAKAAADVYTQLGIYGSCFVLFAGLCIWIIWRQFKRNDKLQDDHREDRTQTENKFLAALKEHGQSQTTALKEVVTEFKESNRELRQDIGGKVDRLETRLAGLNCQQRGNNGRS